MEYKELFNRAKAAYGTGAYDDATLEFIFPELAENEDERMIIGLQGFLSAYGSDYFGTDGWQKFDDWLERQKEQKPRDYRKLYEEVVNSDWFKENYVGKSLGEEQKPEWGEEDEKMLKDIDLALRKLYDASTRLKIETWLKSLRPTHWKPSEAHLSALLAVFNDPNNIGSQTCQLALTDLYEQLNKL